MPKLLRKIPGIHQASFRKFSDRYKRDETKCFCGGEFDTVRLDMSDSQYLCVCCNNNNCDRVTHAKCVLQKTRQSA